MLLKGVRFFTPPILSQKVLCYSDPPFPPSVNVFDYLESQ